VDFNTSNGGNNDNFAAILQLIGQWLTTTGDTVSLIGQTIALEDDRQQSILDQKEKEQQELHQQQTQQQLAQMQEQINQLQQLIEKKSI
jgi:TolA-binding protein